MKMMRDENAVGDKVVATPKTVRIRNSTSTKEKTTSLIKHSRQLSHEGGQFPKIESASKGRPEHKEDRFSGKSKSPIEESRR